MTTTPTTEWFVGSNGNHFRDMGGFRYCVAYISRDRYEVLRNGELMHKDIPSLGAAKMLAQGDGRIHEQYGTNAD